VHRHLLAKASELEIDDGHDLCLRELVEDDDLVDRLSSSGRKTFFSSPMTRPFISSYERPDSSPTVNPKPVFFEICAAPRFEVMITIAFRKSTRRPWASVSFPSSRICRRMLNTSGCAFSISSSRSTEYGLRRTASVSWPPSS